MRNNDHLRKYLGPEDLVQEAFVKYCLDKYGVKVIPMNIESRKTFYEQFKFKTMGYFRGIVDTFVPVAKGGYHGLFIELKKEGRKVFKKDGTFYASGKETHEKQQEFLDDMNKGGYYATFAIGLDEAIDVLDCYMNLD